MIYFRMGNIHNDRAEIDEKMNRITEWFARHKLRLNGGKLILCFLIFKEIQMKVFSILMIKM